MDHERELEEVVEERVADARGKTRVTAGNVAHVLSDVSQDKLRHLVDWQGDPNGPKSTTLGDLDKALPGDTRIDDIPVTLPDFVRGAGITNPHQLRELDEKGITNSQKDTNGRRIYKGEDVTRTVVADEYAKAGCPPEQLTKAVDTAKPRRTA